jgi:hypothetical protein
MGSTDIKLNQAVTHRLNGISSANEALQRNIHGHFVGWKLLGGLEHEFDDFPFSWEFHHPNLLIFCRGVGGSTTNQIGVDFNRCVLPRFILGPALGGFLAARPGQVVFLHWKKLYFL